MNINALSSPIETCSSKFLALQELILQKKLTIILKCKFFKYFVSLIRSRDGHFSENFHEKLTVFKVLKMLDLKILKNKHLYMFHISLTWWNFTVKKLKNKKQWFNFLYFTQFSGLKFHYFSFFIFQLKCQCPIAPITDSKWYDSLSSSGNKCTRLSYAFQQPRNKVFEIDMNSDIISFHHNLNYEQVSKLPWGSIPTILPCLLEATY